MSEKATEKKEKVEKVPLPPRVVQNGIGMPAAGSTSGKIFAISDDLSSKEGPAARKDVLAACEKEGINKATAATQYGRWRRFHGLSREKAAPKEKAEAKA